MPGDVLTAPGVRRDTTAPPPVADVPTGVPVLLGFAVAGPVLEPTALARAADFAAVFGGSGPRGHLGAAVDGFFANGGATCWVVRLDDGPSALEALTAGLIACEALDVDLVCAPDVVRERVSDPRATGAATLPPDPDEVAIAQRAILAHCERSAPRLALLDALPQADVAGVADQASGLDGDDGALYFPWPVTADGAHPPCGHVAGVVARSDRAGGPGRPPANEMLEGVTDLTVAVDDAAQSALNGAPGARSVNCLRAFPGRGVRVWGARTVSLDPAWAFVNVRRVVHTLARRLARTTTDLAFEPHSPQLWARTSRTLTTEMMRLFDAGVLAGATPADAFDVRCDGTLNPAAVREAGRLVAEIRLAPAAPAEVVTVRLVREGAAVDIQTSTSGP